MMDVDLGPAGAAHAAVVAGLHARCFASPWDAESVARVLATPGAGALIARDSRGAPLAFAIYRVAADEAEVLSLATLPEFRRRGIAARVLGAALSAAAEGGARRAYLEVAADDPAALGLYRAAGFEDLGRRPGNYRRGPGAAVDALILGRSLAASAPSRHG